MRLGIRRPEIERAQGRQGFVCPEGKLGERRGIWLQIGKLRLQAMPAQHRRLDHMRRTVSNRGGKASLRYFNAASEGSNDPQFIEHIGDGFLMEQGYSLLWSAWNLLKSPRKSVTKLRSSGFTA